MIVLILRHVHTLDLAGPVQTLYEANGFGAKYDLHYCGSEPKIQSAQGLWISDLDPLPRTTADDLVLIPGMDSSTLHRLEHVPLAWLREAHGRGARVCSICSGAFAVAQAGLLDDRPCTTHWKLADRLARMYPAANVLKNRLYVKDGNIVTSAGVAAGIDMALSLVEEDYGPLVVAKVAREMVVYLRRHGTEEQTSVYLEYRTHLHQGVHRVQDWLIAHPDRQSRLDDLAAIAGMSPRNLTRTFRRATGITLKTFANKVKLEVARGLLGSPDLTVENIATNCGFRDPKQLRRLWKQRFGVNLSRWRDAHRA